MSAAWQDALVVRDKGGVLWGRVGRDMWLSLDGQQVRIGTEGLATSRYSPITPADGQPIVRTVGDLTARHQLTRPQLRVAGREGALKLIKPSDAHPGTLTLIWGDWWEDVVPDTPCEVLE